MSNKTPRSKSKNMKEKSRSLPTPSRYMPRLPRVPTAATSRAGSRHEYDTVEYDYHTVPDAPVRGTEQAVGLSSGRGRKQYTTVATIQLTQQPDSITVTSL